ncbi:hypothetical protein D9756_006686 [Leucocoprinus leucothites]|uniref:Uncharacterized protein n=1 Tax=Leucocoprinus leucothites TaxID=201217 RepID=A0A8H5G1T4_9AGAR|nr:hypothetical protein D9756_006686 [Leucoagaricus leucothites]
MSRRVVSVYVDETRINHLDIAASDTVLDLKKHVKEGLKRNLGLTDDSFNPSAQTNHLDVVISVPDNPSATIGDGDTVVKICPDQNQYILAIVPSAPKDGSSGNNVPQYSLLFPVKPHPPSMPDQTLKIFETFKAQLDEFKTKLSSDDELWRKEVETTKLVNKKEYEENKASRRKNREEALAKIKELETVLKSIKQQLSS